MIASLGWRRASYVGLLVSAGTLFCLFYVGTVASDLFVLLLGMLFSAMGVALGSHLVIRAHLPPDFGPLIGGTVAGALVGAVMSVAGLLVGGALAELFSLRLSKELGWIFFFLPPWIASSGGSAIFARYLVWRLLGGHIVLDVAAGMVGAILGDFLMTFLLVRPFITDPPLQAPVTWTAGLGALIAMGLAWAERPFSRTRPTTPATSTDDPETT
jgi:hypothetical protein